MITCALLHYIFKRWIAKFDVDHNSAVSASSEYLAVWQVISVFLQINTVTL